MTKTYKSVLDRQYFDGKTFVGLSSHTKKGFCSISCQGVARKNLV